MTFPRLIILVLTCFACCSSLSAQDKNNTPPPGYRALFNGKDLTGWKGLPLKANRNDKKKVVAAVVADDDARAAEALAR